MMALRPPLNPRRLTWPWAVSAAAGGAALALLYGFEEPVLTEPQRVTHILLCSSVGLFLLSRLLILIPATGLAGRLRRWWVDYVLITGGLIWWSLDQSKASMILELAAMYSVVLGAGAMLLAGIRGLTSGGTYGQVRPAGLRLLMATIVVALVGGTVLALPVCWDGPYPVTWDSTYPGQMRYELARHWLDCMFTATSALTCTGLAIHDIGCEFNRTGQAVILLLMHVGGLAVLAIGASVCWRIRDLCGWGAADDDTSPTGIGRLIVWVIFAALVLEAIGAGIMYQMWDPDRDANFAMQGDRLLASVFMSISAFCNAGLTLTRDSLISYRGHWAIYGAILPLMLIGSIGLPVLGEVVSRLFRRQGMGMEMLSRHSALTLLVVVLLIAIGTGLLYAIESTPQYQLRNPQAQTPGRLMLPETQSQPASMPLSTRAVERASEQRLSTMTIADRWLAAVFHSVSARSAGLRTARLDEASLSPTSRFVLMASAVIGGTVGGTAGGMRLMILFLLVGAVFARPMTVVYDSVDTKRIAGRQQALSIAAGTVVLLFALIAITNAVLLYRETGSPLMCVSESISACCNVNLSAGLTNHLSIEGRIMLIVAMLVGRVIPLGMLLRCRQVPALSPHAAGPVVVMPKGSEPSPEEKISERISLEPGKSREAEGKSSDLGHP